MAEPFIGQIGMFSFDFPPRGYAKCDGQTLLIAQNQQLSSLLGTQYGGDGVTTFGLPDLRGRVGVHRGPVNKTQGESDGEEDHILAMHEMPLHQHTMMASGSPGNVPVAQGNVLAASANNPYAPPPPALGWLNQGTIPNIGGAPHDNMQPFLTINFSIALQGIPPAKG